MKIEQIVLQIKTSKCWHVFVCEQLWLHIYPKLTVC